MRKLLKCFNWKLFGSCEPSAMSLSGLPACPLRSLHDSHHGSHDIHEDIVQDKQETISLVEMTIRLKTSCRGSKQIT